MSAQLNIKSEDAYRLASRLAELTGESLTSVVTNALRAELKREETARDVDAEVERCWRWAGKSEPHDGAVSPITAGFTTKDGFAA